MSKSRIAPGYKLFQIVVQDYKNRQPAPANVYTDRHRFKKYYDIQDIVPQRTMFKWAKDGKRAINWAKKFGSIIACFKVDSHERRLNMIENMVVEKPIYVDITAEDFTIKRDLTVTIDGKSRKINITP